MKSLLTILFLVSANLCIAQTNIDWKDLFITETTTTTTLTGAEREVPKLNVNQEKLVDQEVVVEGYFIQSSYPGNKYYFFVSNYPNLNDEEEDQIIVDLNMSKGELIIPSNELVKISGILSFNEKDFYKRYFKLSDIKLIK